MKTKSFIILIAALGFSVNGYSQFTFGVSPGIGLSGTYFGYQANDRLMPYIGFQYLNANYIYEESGIKYDWDLGAVKNYTDEIEFSGSVFIPNIGAKYFIKTQNKVKAYVDLNIAKPFLKGELVNDGDENEDFKSTVEALKMWGAELGFGMEYFFDDNFSLGGEFGFRYVKINYDDSYDSDYYNPDTGEYVPSKVDNKITLSSSPTFSKISFNFYF